MAQLITRKMRDLKQYCVIVLILFAGKYPVFAQLTTPMLCPMNYGYFGMANTNTVLGNGAQFNGIGAIGGVRFSAVTVGDAGMHRFYFTDMETIDVGLGKRFLNRASILHNSLLDTTGPYFFFSFCIGAQTFYRITEKIDFGGQIFFNGNIDDCRYGSFSGNDDNVMFGIHARYDQFVLELNEKLPNKNKDYQQNQNAQFVKLIYVYDRKKKKSFALSYDYFYDGIHPNEDMKSSNIRLVWLLPF